MAARKASPDGALDGARAASVRTDIPLASQVGAQGFSILSDIANRQSLTFAPDRAIGVEMAQMGRREGLMINGGQQIPWDWAGDPAQPHEATPDTQTHVHPAHAPPTHANKAHVPPAPAQTAKAARRRPVPAASKTASPVAKPLPKGVGQSSAQASATLQGPAPKRRP